LDEAGGKLRLIEEMMRMGRKKRIYLIGKE
jgi:hypothetical protein